MQNNTENTSGKNFLQNRHTKMFLLIACLMLVCIAVWRIAWSQLQTDDFAEPQTAQTAAGGGAETAPPPAAKKTPPSGNYIVVADDFSNLQITDAQTPVYDIYTLAERREKGLPTEMPDLIPYTMPNVAYLTFDDGPDAKNTPRILDILKERGIHATFYVVGNMAEAHPDVLKRIFAEGHAIGNHSYSHNYSILYPNKENFLEEIIHTDEIIYNILGVRPLIVRAPGGAASMFSSGYDAMLKENGYVNHDWNVSNEDATGNNVSVQKLLGSVSYTCANRPKDRGAIVLMHGKEGKETTVEALPAIIDMLQGAGFTFGVITPRTAQPW
ncbi:polysaccharide deacetylase family protein [Selenomonas sp.]|uniref:polysaccharide deacetylase family protein n=1 Tax=Selenomonas sp. TaxID=2053611 RepID=UPI003FA1E43C